jgi:hypothetical protein
MVMGNLAPVGEKESIKQPRSQWPLKRSKGEAGIRDQGEACHSARGRADMVSGLVRPVQPWTTGLVFGLGA